MLPLITVDESQLGHRQTAVCSRHEAVTKAKTSICTRVEHKLTKLVNLIDNLSDGHSWNSSIQSCFDQRTLSVLLVGSDALAGQVEH